MNHANTGARRKKILLLALTFIMLWVVFALHSRSVIAPQPAVKETKRSTKQFNKQANSTTDAASLWVVVNKQHPLNPKTYKPSLAVPSVTLKYGSKSESMHVSSTMAPALKSLFGGANQAGYTLMLSSGYRSYDYQISVYNSIVHAKGENQADQESARPGYSEHQTGLSADIAPTSRKCDLSQCFGNTPEGKWIAANAYRYGFIIRYPADKEAVTGYEYEPWHLRYIGTDLATEMHDRHVETLEEFFNVSGGTTYN